MVDKGADPFPDLLSVYTVSGFRNSKLSWNIANSKLNSQQTGDSELNSSQSRSISDDSAVRPWYSQNPRPNAWGDPNVLQKLKLSKGSNGGSGVANSNNPWDKSNSPRALAEKGTEILNHSELLPHLVKSPTLEKGLDSSVGVDTIASNPSVGINTFTLEDCENGQCMDEIISELHCENSGDKIVDRECDIVFDSDNDSSLDDTDSNAGEKSHEECKKSKWLRNFFDKLNALTNEEISSQERSWHCPACQGGPGAIAWYKGLQHLVDHSRTMQTMRARLHRSFAETLEEECFRRKAPLTMVGEVSGRWEGLDKKVKDHEVVWPPIIIIMNTKCEQDENNKWNGMGNQELLDCFSDYGALKARHSYGPEGHRGMSVLIFEASTAGYLNAVRLHNQFEEQGRDRKAWNICHTPFLPSGKRRLYGHLASKEDMEIFNRHEGGNSKLKFEVRSYQEMVGSMIKQINDDKQELAYFKSIAAKDQEINSQGV